VERPSTTYCEPEFADRATRTLQDGYNEAKMIDAVRFCWQGWKQSTEPYLRTAVDFLLAYNILLRSEPRLAAEFPDFFTMLLLGETLTPHFLRIIITDNSKMSLLGRLEYGAMMRHRNPMLYTMTHTAFYLFYWWNMIIDAIRIWQVEGINTGAAVEEVELIRTARSTAAVSVISPIKAA
jgi:hypothetical protein